MSEPVLDAPCCRLSDWNRRWSTPQMGLLLTVLVFLISSGFFIAHTHFAHSLTAPPAVSGDSPLYDSLGWELSQGRGYRVNLQDPDFQHPYAAAETVEQLPSISGINVDRPPLYPALLAIGNRLFDRQFWFPRVVQGLLMGSVAAMAAQLAFQCAGLCPALLTAFLFTIVDWRTRWSAREILTESLACWLVMLLALCLIHWQKRQQVRWLALGGAIWGLTLLCRSMTILWLPVLLAALVSASPKTTVKKRLWGAGSFLLAGTLICLPWWWRTCSVLGEFRPLGTQGSEQLSAAYSDMAFQRLGMWFNLDEQGFFSGILVQDDSVRMSLVRARYSSDQAWRWIQAHPVQAALLWPMRVLQEFRPHGPGDLFVLAFALLGLVVLGDRAEGRTGWILLAAQIFAVAATWSVAGRFVIPLLGILHLAAGIGLWSSYVQLVENRLQSREIVLNSAGNRGQSAG